jgi:hypothetical protein
VVLAREGSLADKARVHVLLTSYAAVDHSLETWAAGLGLALFAAACGYEGFLRGHASIAVRLLVVLTVCAGAAIFGVYAYLYVGLHWCGDPTDNPVCNIPDGLQLLLSFAPPALVAAAGVLTLSRETPAIFGLSTAVALVTSSLYALLPAG